MDHLKIYNDIVRKAKNEGRDKKDCYYESHHVVPKSIGGPNTKENMVLLTPKEHFVCHRLLIEIYRFDHSKYLSMLRAFMMLSTKNNKQQQRYINSRSYEKIKNSLYGENGILTGENSNWYGRRHTDESKEKMSKKHLGELNPRFNKSPWNKGKTKHTDFRIKQYSETIKNNEYIKNRPPISDSTRELLSESAKRNNLGKTKTEEHKQQLSLSLKKLYSTDSDYRKKQHARSMKGAEVTRGVSKEKITCPHCGKTGGKPAMTRFHFSKCKMA